MFYLLALVQCALQFDNRTLEKTPVDLDAPPYTLPLGLVDAQIKVIPRILEFLAEFTGNRDVSIPEHAVNYLNSLATYPYKVFEARELVSKLIKKRYNLDITRTDEFEIAEALKNPEPVQNVVVSEFYKYLRGILELMIIKQSEGDHIYLIMALSNSINNYILIKDQLKQAL